MTKPEGPAQEPLNVGGETKCKNCEQPKSAHLVSGHIYCPIGLGRACWYEPVDAATPAPAVTNRFCTRCGKLNDGHQHGPPTRDRHDRPAFTGCCGTPTTGLSYVNPQHRADCPLRNAPSQPAGECGSRVHYGSVDEPNSATCHKDAEHNDTHAYVADQPAAREAEAFVTKFARERHVKFPDTWDFIYELLDAYLAQQTAAKDAELKACWNQLCDIGFMFDVVTPENNLRLAEIVKHKKEAAERERDSLREALKPISNTVAYLRKAYSAGADAEVVHAITDLQRYCTTVDAALKAGKE